MMEQTTSKIEPQLYSSIKSTGKKTTEPSGLTINTISENDLQTSISTHKALLPLMYGGECLASTKTTDIWAITVNVLH